MERRTMLKSLLALGMTSLGFHQPNETGSKVAGRIPGAGLRLGLNAYSFNELLSNDEMVLADLVDFCAEHGIEGLDATGYYFSTYPAPPPDEEIFQLKRRAFVNGLTIYGTGVRNDFCEKDTEVRRAEVRKVQQWIEVAGKLGCGMLRVFAGPGVPEGDTFAAALERVAEALRECADHGRRHGVIVAVQNHNDFLQTAEQTIRLIEAVGSPWCGVLLDIGSLRRGDPYREIEILAPYAVGWQLKETVWFGEEERPVDLSRLRRIVEAVGYRGFLSLETLGSGDPRAKVTRLLDAVLEAFG
ncbi:MAG: hypothetical protein Kow00109_28680 [Acidobacteriota bacterium]